MHTSSRPLESLQCLTVPRDTKPGEVPSAVNTSYTTRYASARLPPFELLFSLSSNLPRQDLRSHRIGIHTERLVTLPDWKNQASRGEYFQEMQKTMNDKTSSTCLLHMSDFVWIQQQPTAHTFENLSPKFKGPHQVTRQRIPPPRLRHKHKSVT